MGIKESFRRLRKRREIKMGKRVCYEMKTRTKCQIIKTKIKNTEVVIKYSPIKENINPKESATYSEIKMLEITNKLKDDKICDNFVRSYNRKYLKGDIIKDEGKWKTMLITENLKAKGYERLKTKIRNIERKDLKDIIFKIIYSISCMGHMNMGHMDLHFDNIYIKKAKTDTNIYDEYEYMYKEGKYEKVYIKSKYEIKIIDFDGAYKMKSGNKKLKRKYRKEIKNINIYSGRVTKANPRTNVMKVLHELEENEIMNKINYIKDENGRIPYKNKDIKEIINKHKNIHKEFTKKYGIYMKEKEDELVELSNNDVKTPMRILKEMKMRNNKKNKKIRKKYTQKNLFY